MIEIPIKFNEEIMYKPLPSKMNQDQLGNYLELLIKEILKQIMAKNPAMKLGMTPEKIDALAKNVAKIMMQKGMEFSREDVIDKNPKFIEKLTVAIICTAKLDGKDDLFNDIKKILSLNDIKLNELKNKTIEDLKKEKRITPEEANKLTVMFKKLEETLTDLKELSLVKTPKLTPGEREPKIDPLIVELLGVLLVGQTGSIQPTIFQFNGNLLGIVDKNPNNGLAQIDQQDKINSIFGDSQGMQHAKKERFEATGCTFKELIDNVQAVAMRLKPGDH